MDRNEKARNDFKIAQARREFQQAVAAGRTGVIDRFGALVKADDLVIWFPPREGLVWRVKDIGPDLSPHLPPGMMKVIMEVIVPVQYQAGQPCRDLLRVGQQKSEGHSELVTPQGADPTNTPTEQPAPAELTDGPIGERPFVPCDGNHPEPICGDPECWRLLDQQVRTDSKD